MVTSINSRILRIISLLLIMAFSCPFTFGKVIYVDNDDVGANNGSNWANAYWCLQDALATAQSGDEIRVAQGIYKPDQYIVMGRSPFIEASGDREATFQLKNGVAIRGGYAGSGEPLPDERDIYMYKTILSGDLNGDDGPNFANNSENSHHVVTASGINETTVLDGFIVTKGNAEGTFPENCGGGIYCDTFLEISNNVIVGNSAMYGGAIYCFSSSPSITNCTIVGNLATGYGGGGIYRGNSSPTVANTILWNNNPDEIYSKGSSVNVTYSNVQGGWLGIGNIATDPLFIDADGADDVMDTEDDDLRLLPDSPCIDAGDNSAIPSSVATDLDGNPRIINGTVDMGAYETDVAPKANIYYVDADATGTNDGTSWENAYVCLQDALATVENVEKPIEIRVAQGIYRPDQHAMMRQDQLRIISSGDWTATFQLIDGVMIEGGYAGIGEPYPDARDVDLYESILSGDLNADDDPEFTNIWDNSYHIVTASGTQWTAILGGFTITGGNADGPFPNDHGGGIYNIEGSPTLIDCTLLGNSTIDSGGGMYNSLYSNPALINCNFSGNLADIKGGGMFNDKSDPMLTNCTFSENSAGGGGGGGMYNEGSIPMLADCDFTGNSTTGSGGGMYNNSSDSVLLSCLFSTNSASRSGGGMYNRYTSQPSLTNCIFSGNSARNGGGMENLNTSQPILFNCTFSANIAENTGGGISNIQDSQLTLINCILWGDIPDAIRGPAYVSYSDIEGGWSGVGMSNLDIDPLFADPDNGDYHLKSRAGRWDPDSQSWVIDPVSSPCIDAGDPGAPIDLERFPNGGRINMGAYGGTPEASLSPQPSLPLLGQASNPDPPDGAVRVSRNITLTWTPGFEGALHNVYLGIEFDHVDPSNVNSVLVSQHQADNSYNPGILEYGQTYYWRVDEADNQGMIITGAVWSFTTSSGPSKGRACFTGETGVWVDGELVRFSNVTEEQVNSGIDGFNKIEHVQEHEGAFTLYDVLLESGNCITVAENHYFMTESGYWLSLKNLKAGLRLKTAKGTIGIKNINKQSKPYIGKVYNLKIEGSDKYLVGEDAVIVRDY